MKQLPIVILYLTFQSTLLIAQNGSISANVFTARDNPAKLTEINQAGFVTGTLLSKRNNSHGIQFFRHIPLKNNVGLNLGVGYGLSQFKLEYFRSEAEPGTLFSPNPIFQISLYSTHYLTLTSGFSYIEHVTSNIFLSLNLNAGGIFLSRSTNNQIERFITPSNTAELKTDFGINEQFKTSFVINPKIDIGYRKDESPISINVGIASMIAPQEIIAAKFELTSDAARSELEMSDNLVAIGLSVGLRYHL